MAASRAWRGRGRRRFAWGFEGARAAARHPATCGRRGRGPRRFSGPRLKAGRPEGRKDGRLYRATYPPFTDTGERRYLVSKNGNGRAEIRTQPNGFVTLTIDTKKAGSPVGHT